MIENIILILSDSTSMTLGLERHIHHMKLADKKIWPDNTRIVNCSIPGMTAADAATYFFLNEKKYSIACVFIYLGNCDTISNETIKGDISKFKIKKQLIRNLVFGERKKSKLRNRLLFNEWNKTLDLSIETEESPVDFKKNIKLITAFCAKKDIPVLMIKSHANKFFLPGLGKGNFSFYKYLGVDDKINPLKIEDNRFINAYTSHSNKNFTKALEEYKVILNNPLSYNLGREYPLVILHNYAVAKAEQGEFEEAQLLLKLFVNENVSRREIGLYNLAQISKREGNQRLYKEFLDQSFENDNHLYRVRKPYQIAIEDISSEDKNIHLVDMEKLLDEDDFLDHCHPLPKGQEKMAKKIQEIYASIGIEGKSKAKITNDLHNPELANGNFTKFQDYFKTYSKLSKDEIDKQFQKYFSLVEKHGNEIESYLLVKEGISESIHNACNYFFKHPLYTSLDDLKYIETFYPSDIGRFPEYFFYRTLMPHLSKIESNQGDLFKSYNLNSVLVHSSESFQVLLNDLGIQSDFFEINENNLDKKRVQKILEKTEELLVDHLKKGNTIFNRLKTTIYWYVREALRFGSHSRYSMRYDRVLLEYIAEALIICEYYNKTENYGFDLSVEKLKETLLMTVEVHEKYCIEFDLNNYTSLLIDEYESELLKIHNKL